MIKRRKLRTVITGIIYTIMREEMVLGSDHCEYMRNFIKTKDQLTFEDIADEYVRHLKDVLKLEFRQSLRDEHSDLIGKLYETHVAYRYRGIDPSKASIKFPIQPPAVIVEFIKTEGDNDLVEFNVFIIGIVRITSLLSHVKEKKPGVMRLVESLREIARYMVTKHAISLNAYIDGIQAYRMTSKDDIIGEGFSPLFKKYLSDKAYQEFMYNDMIEVNFAPGTIYSNDEEVKYDVPDIELEDMKAFFGKSIDRVYDYDTNEYRSNVVQIDTKAIMIDVMKVLFDEVNDNKKFI